MRTRPHTAAPARSGTASSPVVATAPLVTRASLAWVNRSSASQDWISPSAWSTAARTSAGTPSGPAGRDTDANTTSGTGAPASTAAPNPARSVWCSARPRSSPSAATRPVVGLAGTGSQSTRNSASPRLPRAALSWSGTTGREVSAATVATGVPAASATSTAVVSAPTWASRTRSVVAPVACSRTPDQENGSRPVPSVFSAPSATACRAASSRAGCTPNRMASPWFSLGSATSAKTSSPRRQAARSPWKVGP